ncbi:MAG: Rne/Rng family ribonuclease [Rhodobacteraceae bacterium]|nr:Rne/Rng family ribonuclease [Paracoccaceae bacterium]
MDHKLLIDAAFPEEIRVAALEDGKLQDYYVESSTGTQYIRNIYLAKIEKVEPSLQAAFVNYGANRHGFLPFRRIHPTYYRIPGASAKKTIESDQFNGVPKAPASSSVPADAESDNPYSVAMAGFAQYDRELASVRLTPAPSAKNNPSKANGSSVKGSKRKYSKRGRSNGQKQYRIQDVIRKGQVLIVQVKKDEIDEKGAALDTYISLAGHYCVLLPNTDRGCILSSKISSERQRKRLQKIYSKLELGQNAAMIMRTAGCNQKEETIRREYNSLVKDWNEIMRKACNSKAPAPLHIDGRLIDRSLRDIFKSSAGVVHVQGDEAYQHALSYVKQEIPEAMGRIHLHSGPRPLFAKHRVSGQVRKLYQSEVQLKSGGCIVIEPTEALVSIDVNSGKATQGNTLTETALKTNLEAASEIARQIQLRDLSGLIVIDFIDMDEVGHRAEVEKRFKAESKRIRGRTRVGFITSFGLLEMSRQRLGRDYLGQISHRCVTCQGSGRILQNLPMAVSILRHIEEECSSRRVGMVAATVPVEIANGIYNELRHHCERIEERHQLRLFVRGETGLQSPNYAFALHSPHNLQVIHEFDSGKPTGAGAKSRDRGSLPSFPLPHGVGESVEGGIDVLELPDLSLVPHGDADAPREPESAHANVVAAVAATDGSSNDHGSNGSSAATKSASEKRKRRGRRGGRRRKRKTSMRNAARDRVGNAEQNAAAAAGIIESPNPQGNGSADEAGKDSRRSKDSETRDAKSSDIVKAEPGITRSSDEDSVSPRTGSRELRTNGATGKRKARDSEIIADSSFRDEPVQEDEKLAVDVGTQPSQGAEGHASVKPTNGAAVVGEEATENAAEFGEARLAAGLEAASEKPDSGIGDNADGMPSAKADSPEQADMLDDSSTAEVETGKIGRKAERQRRRNRNSEPAESPVLVDSKKGKPDKLSEKLDRMYPSRPSIFGDELPLLFPSVLDAFDN